MLVYIAAAMFALAAYLVYTRVIRMYLKIRYYEKQGAAFIKGVTPVLGHLPRYKTKLDIPGNTVHPWVTCINEDFGTGKLPKVIGMFNSYEPTFMITDPEMINEAYVQKNLHFDKHESVANALYTLMGDNVIFMKNSNE
jgi:hypothetical protein